jgi:septal ring factor EnvC (AmiA/AmiB activator)
MTSSAGPRALFLAALAALWALAGWQIAAQQGQVYDSAEQADAALRAALFQQNAARQRGDKLEAEAKMATAAAERTARESAAVAARIQEAEAQIAAAQAQISLIDRQQQALRARLAVKQEPLVRLTAALQLMARRPLLFSLLRPGSLRETVYVRAVFETMLPEVEKRTASLRGEVVRIRQFRDKARLAQKDLKDSQAKLAAKSRELAAIESRQRLESRAALGDANRETDRALALSEEARDLKGLMGRLEQDGAVRSKLAALPGPVLRPDRPGEARVTETAAASEAPGSLAYILPVAGRLVSGFGEVQPGGTASGTTFAAQSQALVVAPAAGRVAFAGPYRGYGRIVIIEHPGGWTTLVTNLGRTDVSVGQQLLQGAALGQAGAGQPTIMVELRKDGAPVNIMGLVGG